MSRFPLTGALFILAGILLAVLPDVLLPVCSGQVSTASGAAVPMRCFWTARAEIGVGALVSLGGVLYCLCRNTGARLGIAAVTAGAALLAVALPAGLTGVCAAETMPCRMGTLPGLVLVGVAVFFAALSACRNLSRSLKEKDKP